MSEELLSASKARIEDLLQPVNGGVGEDISYDDKFEEIKSETEKLSSLTGESPDWGNVGVIAEELLQEKSKDFRVACYLATCKCMQGDLEGVLDGLVLIDEMAKKFWDDMYPPLRRIRARAGMVGWMSDQAGPVAIEYKLRAKDNALVKAIDDYSKQLDANFRERFADHYPGMSKLRDAVRHWLRTCPKEAPKVEPKPEPAKPAPVQPGAAPAAAAAAPVATASVDVTGAADALKALKPVGKNLVAIASAIRGEKPENDVAYKLSRLGMWLELNQTPPATDGKTLVPPPPANVRQSLDALAKSQDWMTLIQQSEKAAGNFILWLDPHRHTSTAMSALGALFIKAKKALLLQVALHLQKLPTLPGLQFNDGTPFADPQTQMWIENEVMPVLSADGAGGGGGPASSLDEPLKEAKDLAMKGELAKAVDLISHAAEAAPTPAEKFRGRLAVAQLCLGAGQHAIARSQLEGLTQMIKEHDLTSWDPRLCADVYGALYTAIKGVNDAKLPKPGVVQQLAGGQKGPPALPPEDVAAQQAAFEWLCRLDPAEALKLAGNKK